MQQPKFINSTDQLLKRTIPILITAGLTVQVLLAPDSLFVLKAILTLFDLGTGLLVVAWLKENRTSPKWSVLYFFNPLLLKEIANSAHLDSIAVFFSVAAGLLLIRSENGIRSRSNSSLAWGALALAVGSKLYPICLVPLFLKLDRRRRWRGLAFFSGVLLLLYLPVFFAGLAGLNGTEAFARQWIFNASLFRVFQKLAENFVYLASAIGSLTASRGALLLRNDLLAKMIGGTVFIFFALYRVTRASSMRDLPSEAMTLLGALLILSPVVNAWYVLWILPFACIARSVPWLAFSYLVVAGYCWWYSPNAAFYLKWTEYVTFFSLLAIFGMIRKNHVASNRIGLTHP